MRSKKQEEEMKVKILFLSKLFLESNYSDIELSNITGISSSSVGRYLTSDLAKELIFIFLFVIIFAFTAHFVKC